MEGGIDRFFRRVRHLLRQSLLSKADLVQSVINLNANLTALRQEVSQADAKLTARLLQVEVVARQASAALQRERDDAALRGLMLRLDACAMRWLAAGQGAEHRGLATHYARAADFVRREWMARRAWPPDPFPEDDGSLDYAKRAGVFIPGNEVEVESDRPFLPWRPLLADPECGVFLVMGQSNAGNHGETPYSPHRDVFSLDFLSMRCFAASDPLPGCSGWGGSIWSRLGEKLVERGVCRRVLFVPIAFGGSFVTDWIPGGTTHRRTLLLLSRLQKERGDRSPMPFSAVFWQQGEAEANHTTIAAATYQRHFHEVLADLRQRGVFAPVFVARATLCDAASNPCRNHAEIRTAQANLVDASNGILAGPDTDTIGPDGRHDGCHLSQAGLERCAELWFDVLRECPWLRSTS